MFLFWLLKTLKLTNKKLKQKTTNFGNDFTRLFDVHDDSVFSFVKRGNGRCKSKVNQIIIFCLKCILKIFEFQSNVKDLPWLLWRTAHPSCRRWRREFPSPSDTWSCLCSYCRRPNKILLGLVLLRGLSRSFINF